MNKKREAQCDQIWRNFAKAATFLQFLAIVCMLTLYLTWTLFDAIEHIFKVTNGKSGKNNIAICS